MRAASALYFSAVLFAGCSEGPETRTSATSDPYVYPPEPVGRNGPASGCVVCHSLSRDGTLRVAPSLWGIVGAKKARYEWYGYSPALATAGGVWTEQELDQYLADPGGYLPGTKKTLIGITDPQERDELIAYLQELRD